MPRKRVAQRRPLIGHRKIIRKCVKRNGQIIVLNAGISFHSAKVKIVAIRIPIRTTRKIRTICGCHGVYILPVRISRHNPRHLFVHQKSARVCPVITHHPVEVLTDPSPRAQLFTGVCINVAQPALKATISDYGRRTSPSLVQNPARFMTIPHQLRWLRVGSSQCIRVSSLRQTVGKAVNMHIVKTGDC